jgi:ribose transport system substrate-binding protein
MLVRKKKILAISVVLGLLFLACGGDDGGDGAAEDTGATAEFDLSQETQGPNGEPATSAEELGDLTPEQVDKVRQKNYKIALLQAGTSTWFNALADGMRAEADRLGMDIVLTTDSQFDPAKQAADVETAMAKDPDIILTLPVDPVSAAEAFQPAVDAGVKLVFVDNGIDGYTAGEEYVAIVTGDHYGMGRAAAELMADALGEDGGQIGYIFHDADFYVTNNRDQYFKAVIEQEYPEIEIVAEEGFTDEAATEQIASAMLTQNPDLNGIYVAWSAAATGVFSALRAAGETDIEVVSHDLDATNDLEMAQGGLLYGVAADKPYLEGQIMVRLAALSLLGEETPPFVTVDVVKETRENIPEAWNESLNQDPPQEILDALAAE